MSVSDKISKRQKLEFEIDLRLADIWSHMDEVEEWDLEKAAGFARAAYAAGYTSALTEEIPGELLLDAPGFRIAGRRR